MRGSERDFLRAVDRVPVERTAEGPTAEEYLEFCIWDGAGYGAGKKVKGRKRHFLLDTLGLLLSVIVHFAGYQRPRWHFPLATPSATTVPFTERTFADSGYRGDKLVRLVSRTGVWKIRDRHPLLLLR